LCERNSSISHPVDEKKKKQLPSVGDFQEVQRGCEKTSALLTFFTLFFLGIKFDELVGKIPNALSVGTHSTIPKAIEEPERV
jgi:hypothetical protein